MALSSSDVNARGFGIALGHHGKDSGGHQAIGDPLLRHALFPIYVGALIWTGL